MTRILPFFLTFLFYLNSFSQVTYNASLLPLGDKEPLMANTGTGGLGSTGAVYYNPAALTMVDETSLSLSGDAYMSYKYTAKPLTVILGTPIDYEAAGFESIPTSVITVKKYKTWRFAFSALVPASFNYEGVTDWEIPFLNQQLKLKLSQDVSEKILISGLTTAKDLGSGWAVGISAFAQFYSYLQNLDLQTTLPISQEFLLTTKEREKMNPTSLLLIAGLQKRWEKINIGLKITLPNIYMFGKGDYYRFNYSNSGSTSGIETSEINIKRAKVLFSTPWEFRIGTTYLPSEKINIAFDMSYSTDLTYNAFDTPEYVDEHVIKGNFRFSLGNEILLGEKLSSYVGAAFTPIVIEQGDEIKKNEVIDFWSFFAGIRNNSDKIESSLGFFYTAGSHERQLQDYDGSAENRIRYLGIFLGTNYKL